MMRWIALMGLLCCVVGCQSHREDQISITSRTERAHRWLPHQYQDQVLASIRGMYPDVEIWVDVRHHDVQDTSLSICVYAHGDQVEATCCSVRGDVAEFWSCAGARLDQVEAALIQKYGDLYRSAKREASSLADAPESR